MQSALPETAGNQTKAAIAVESAIDDSQIDDFSLEVRIKSINYIGDFLLKALEAFHDKRPILERYMRGELECHHHSAASAYCARTVMMHGGLDFEKMPMLIGIGEVKERLGPLTPKTRLQQLERCLVWNRQIMEPHFAPIFAERFACGQMFVPAFFSAFDQKLRSVQTLTRIQINKLIDEVIEGSAEIVERLPDENGNDWGSADVFESASNKCWTNNWRRDRAIGRKDGSNLILKACDMILCPTYSRTCIIKGWLDAIGAY